jgi:hypothetical protein
MPIGCLFYDLMQVKVTVCQVPWNKACARCWCSLVTFFCLCVYKENRGRGRRSNAEDGLSARQKSRIISKETISTSESDSDSNQLKIASGWVRKCINAV